MYVLRSFQKIFLRFNSMVSRVYYCYLILAQLLIYKLQSNGPLSVVCLQIGVGKNTNNWHKMFRGKCIFKENLWEKIVDFLHCISCSCEFSCFHLRFSCGIIKLLTMVDYTVYVCIDIYILVYLRLNIIPRFVLLQLPINLFISGTPTIGLFHFFFFQLVFDRKTPFLFFF